MDKGQPLASRKSKSNYFSYSIPDSPFISSNPPAGAPGSAATIGGSGFPPGDSTSSNTDISDSSANNTTSEENQTGTSFPVIPVAVGGGVVLAGAITVVVVKTLISSGRAAAKAAAETAANAAATTSAATNNGTPLKPPHKVYQAAKEAMARAAGPVAAVVSRIHAKNQAYERYVNLWFTHQRADERLIPRESPLVRGKTVYLRVQIAPFDQRTILENAVPFPRQKDIEKAHPELKGKPIPLDVTLFSSDFDIPENEKTQKLTLIYGQPAEKIFFQVSPVKIGPGSLRLCVFYRNHLLQSLAISVSVVESEGIPGESQKARVEVAYDVDFSRVPQLPARKVWLGINESATGTHNLYIKSDTASENVVLSRDLNNKIQNAINRARQALQETSFFKINEEIDFNCYRFDENNFPREADGRLLTEEEARERFRLDMANLAAVGSALFDAVFGDVPRAEERELVRERIDKISAELKTEQVIQITRILHFEDIWPWALMYDLPVDRPRVKEVCLAFRGHNHQALSYNICHANCRHPELQNEGLEDTIICPFGFWGFKHIIEQPTQPGKSKALSSLSREIKITGNPKFEMPIARDFIECAEPHLIKMEQEYKFHRLNSPQEVYQVFKGQPEPQLIYFFCHGDRDADGTPLLLIGDRERLPAMILKKWNFRWPHTQPLVFLNGCGTVGFLPDDLAMIMAPFVNADVSGIIGTEITVYTYLATEFAEKFFKALLPAGREGSKVGESIRAVRLELLSKYNPLGLVYTPYCSADLKIVS